MTIEYYQCNINKFHSLENRIMDDCTSVKSELMASRRVVEIAMANNYKYITIFHDYNNTSNFVNKQCIARDPFCKYYVRFMENAKKHIDIRFIQIKSKKDKNKVADALCKRAIKELKAI
jgi:ribonuclease H-related protein